MSRADPDRETLRIRWRLLGAVLLVVGTVSTVALRFVETRGMDVPPLPLLLAALLLLVAVVVAVLGLRMRRWVRRGDRVDPLGATSTLVLGQSAALSGAAVAGYCLAQLVLAVPRIGAPDPDARLLAGLVCLVAAGLTAGAGMLAQWCCLVPDDDDPPPPGRGPLRG